MLSLRRGSKIKRPLSFRFAPLPAILPMPTRPKCSRQSKGSPQVCIRSSMRMEFQHDPPPPPGPGSQVDTSKRYDIYFSEPGRGIVVYRNALFKGSANLLPGAAGGRMIHHDFLELEQANGQPVFISRNTVLKFCAPGTAIQAEQITK
jgi:hypothetical protein